MLHFPHSSTVACSHSALDFYGTNVFHLFSQPFKQKPQTLRSTLSIRWNFFSTLLFFLLNFYYYNYFSVTKTLCSIFHWIFVQIFTTLSRHVRLSRLLMHKRTTWLAVFRPLSVILKRSPYSSSRCSLSWRQSVKSFV